jgi:hypothetical protein
MDPAQMLARCPHSPQRGTGWLEGWRLTFGGEDIGWDGALTTIVEDAAEQVFVSRCTRFLLVLVSGTLTKYSRGRPSPAIPTADSS